MTKITGMQMIAREREAAQSKGHTPESDYEKYGRFGLKEIAVALISPAKFPAELPREYGEQLRKKPYRERLAIAGQFLAAEIEYDILHEERRQPKLEDLEKQKQELEAKIQSLRAQANELS